jgi:tetratricopeptide (TPR) repeat protein
MIGNRDGVAVSLDNRGLLYLAMGQLDQAQADLEEALLIRQQLGDSWGIGQTRANLAQVALMQANPEAAEHHAEQALLISQSIDSVEIKAEASWISALVYAENNRLDEALQMAEQALTLSREAGLSQQEAHSLRIMGGLHRRLDNFDEAETLLNQALELSHSRNDPYLQGQILLEFGQLYQDKAHVMADSCFEKATLHFEKLGASWYLHAVPHCQGWAEPRLKTFFSGLTEPHLAPVSRMKTGVLCGFLFFAPKL